MGTRRLGRRHFNRLPASEEGQRTPSFESIVLPIATRLGASVAAGISMFNEKAEILPFCSTHPVHHPRFGALEKRHPDFAVAAFKPNDIARNRLRTDRRIELLLRQPGDEASFLDG